MNNDDVVQMQESSTMQLATELWPLIFSFLPLDFLQHSKLALVSHTFRNALPICDAAVEFRQHPLIHRSSSFEEQIIRLFPKIRHLNFTNCRSLTNGHVARLLTALPSLEVLLINSCFSVTDSFLQQLQQPARNLRMLGITSLSKLTRAVFEVHFPSLEVLAVPNVSLEDWNNGDPVLANYPSVRALFLGGLIAKNCDVPSFLQSFPSLRVLELSAAGKTDKEHIAGFCTECTLLDLAERQPTRLELAQLARHADLSLPWLRSAISIAIHFVSYRRQTLVHHAVNRNNSQLLDWCISHGARIDAKDFKGNTPLFYACEQGHIEIVQRLMREIDHYYDDAHQRRALYAVKNNASETMLYIASLRGHFDVVKLLFERFVHMYQSASETVVNTAQNITDRILQDTSHHGFTALHAASFGGFIEIVRFFIERGANINIIDRYHYTPLHLASMKHFPQLAKLLIESGAAANARTNSNLTPADCAKYIMDGESPEAVARNATGVRNPLAWTTRRCMKSTLDLCEFEEFVSYLEREEARCHSASQVPTTANEAPHEPRRRRGRRNRRRAAE